MSRFAGKTAPFNPANLPPDKLEYLLVGRDKEVEVIVEDIVYAAKEGTAPPQRLIVAPRGFGKTHFLRIIQGRLISNETAKNSFLISSFKEEEHVCSYLDFLRRILDRVEPEFRTPELETQIENIFSGSSSETEVEEFLDRLIDGRLLVLIIENLGDIFEGLGDEGQKKFRSFLQEVGKVSIVASAQRLMEPLISKKFPFFGFFARQDLKPLDKEDAKELLKRLARLGEDKELEEFLETDLGKGRAAAACHLAGGNHRLMVLLSGFLNKERLEELTGAFMDLIETTLTPYYQEQLARLAPLQRRIVEILCERGDGIPIVVKEIAQRALTSSQSISAQLRKMEVLGILYSARTGRSTRYEMAEPLWRVSIEVKNNVEGILPIVVNFLKLIYGPDTLFDQLASCHSKIPIVEKHLIVAIEESLRSMEKSDRDEVVFDKVQELYDCLPDNLDKAEKLVEALSRAENREPFYFLKDLFQVFKNKKPFKALKRPGKSFFCWSALLGFINYSGQFPDLKKDKKNLLLLIKADLSFLEHVGSIPDITEMNTNDSNITAAWIVLFLLEEPEKAFKFMKKLSNASENGYYGAIRILVLIETEIIEKPLLDFLKLVPKKNLNAHFFIIFVTGLFKKKWLMISRYLDEIGNRMSKVQKKHLMYFLRVTLFTNKKFLEGIWKPHHFDILEFFSKWQDIPETTKFINDANEYLKGNVKSFETLPVEVKNILLELDKVFPE
jgi:DNA-binding transcriptional ArsR family regulator